MKISNPKSRILALLCIIGIVSFIGCAQLNHSNQQSQDSSLSNGVPAPKLADMKSMLPDSIGQGKPAILDFSSKFCLACQQIKPKLEKVVHVTPSIRLYSINVQAPQGSKDNKLFKAFKVTSAPYVVFISGSGQVKKVFYEDTSFKELSQAAELIRKQ